MIGQLYVPFSRQVPKHIVGSFYWDSCALCTHVLDVSALLKSPNIRALQLLTVFLIGWFHMFPAHAALATTRATVVCQPGRLCNNKWLHVPLVAV